MKMRTRRRKRKKVIKRERELAYISLRSSISVSKRIVYECIPRNRQNVLTIFLNGRNGSGDKEVVTGKEVNVKRNI